MGPPGPPATVTLGRLLASCQVQVLTGTKPLHHDKEHRTAEAESPPKEQQRAKECSNKNQQLTYARKGNNTNRVQVRCAQWMTRAIFS